MSIKTEATKPADGRGGGAWAVPAFAVLGGGVLMAIFLAHHNVAMAVVECAIVVGYAAVLVLGSRRSEAAALLRGQFDDERRRTVEQRAAALTMHVLACVLVGGFIVSLIRDTGAMTWATLCAVAGFVYIGSTIVLTRRG